MRLVTGKLNGVWLSDLLEEGIRTCDWIKVAMAYVNGDPKLIQECFQRNVPLSLWCRYDQTVPVSISVLERFLLSQSPNHICKLVPELFHPKVIWWAGFGVYIGSANLTTNGWMRNIECGIFLSESEMETQGLTHEIELFFQQVDQHSHPLTSEVISQLKLQEKINRVADESLRIAGAEFEKKRLFPALTSLISVDKKKAEKRLEEEFLREWYETLETLRMIQEKVSRPENRPSWVTEAVPKGVQADQFLHAFYYSRVRTGNSYPHQEWFERNRKNRQRALDDAISWWKALDAPPTGEDITMYEWSPVLRELLAQNELPTLDANKLEQVCSKIHAMRDHALRIDNETYGLPKNTPKKDREECTRLLADFLWRERSASGRSIREVIGFVLYGGAVDDVPKRLWTATQDPNWRLAHFGVSSLGELIGWAMPDKYPPRNGRSSKALRALGFDVRIHSGA